VTEVGGICPLTIFPGLDIGGIKASLDIRDAVDR
jgi:hypothetical protein